MKLNEDLAIILLDNDVIIMLLCYCLYHHKSIVARNVG